MRTTLSRRDCTLPRQFSAWRGWQRIGFVEDDPLTGAHWAYVDAARTDPQLFPSRRDALAYLVQQSQTIVRYSKASTDPFRCTVCGRDAKLQSGTSISTHACEAVTA